MSTYKIEAEPLRHKRVPLRALLTFGFALFVFAGCYWAPESDEGDIAISISIPQSGIGSQDIGALENGSDTFLYVFVLDEALMKLSPAQAALIHARVAYGDVTYAMERAVNDADFDVAQAASGFSMPVGLSSDRFRQLSVATSGTGSHAFTGLPAGRKFLVGVYAVEYVGINGSNPYQLHIGYGTATVPAGQTALVNIDMAEDPIPFFDYVINEYNLARLEFNSAGISGNTGLNISGPLYFDLLTTLHTDFGDLDQGSPTDFDSWYQDESVAIVDVSRATQSKSGSRRPFRSVDTRFHIVGVLPNDSWNILITEWDSRTDAESENNASLRRQFFSAPARTAVNVSSYDGNSLYYNVFLS